MASDRLDGSKVLLVSQFSGDRSMIEDVSTLVDWRGRQAEHALREAAIDQGADVYTIGNAVAPRTVAFAVAEAAAMAERYRAITGRSLWPYVPPQRRFETAENGGVVVGGRVHLSGRPTR